jgi:hypothetical protein
MKFFPTKPSNNKLYIVIAFVIINSIMRVCAYGINIAGWRRVSRFTTFHGVSNALSYQV